MTLRIEGTGFKDGGFIVPSAIIDCNGCVGVTGVGGILCSQGNYIEWVAPPPAGIACSILAAKGDIVVATASATATALPVGTDGQVLTACSACSSGLTWAAGGGGGGGSPATPTVAGLLPGCDNSTNGITAVGSNALLSLTAGTQNVAIGLDAGCSLTTGSSNVAVGASALCSVIDTTENTAVGDLALWKTTGDSNTAVGSRAGKCVTVGYGNTAVGRSALEFTCGGDYNSGVGVSALRNACGNYNTALGYQAGYRSDGDNNVFIGADSGAQVLTGAWNTFLGYNSGFSVVSGCNNVLIGTNIDPGADVSDCLMIGTGGIVPFTWLTGDSTSAIKPSAGIIDCAGSCGTAGQVLMSNGANAVCWGTAGGGGGSGTVTDITAGAGLTGGTITTSGTIAINSACVLEPVDFTAKGQVLVGTGNGTYTALAVGTNGQYLIANSLCTQGVQWLTAPFLNCNLLTAKGSLISASAANTPSTIPVGTNGQVLTACSTCLGGMTWTTASGGSAATPTAAGTVFGCTMSAGLLNTALGNNALAAPGSFGCNTAVGYCALASSTSAYFNTAVGNCAGKIVSGTNNTFVGNRAGGAFTAGGFNQSSATAIGAGAMANSTGAGSTVVGQSAGNYMNGNYNVGVGTSALHGSFSGMTGAFNIGIGDFAGCGLSTGCCNIAIGFQSLTAADTAVCNTGVGFQTLCNVTSGINNIAIGPNSGTVISGDTSGIVNLTTESNRIVMGNFNHTCAQIKIGWTVTSDVRDKAIDPAGVPYGLSFVNQITPISYCWCDRATGEVTENRKRFGFSAQNICALETETEHPVIVSADDPEHLMITDQALLPVLVNAIKELSAKNDQLEERLKALESQG